MLANYADRNYWYLMKYTLQTYYCRWWHCSDRRKSIHTFGLAEACHSTLESSRTCSWVLGPWTYYIIIERTPLLIPERLTGYFREMLSQWLKWSPPNHSWPTLKSLELVLQRSGHEGLAVQLSRRKVLSQLTVEMLVHVWVKRLLIKHVLQN